MLSCSMVPIRLMVAFLLCITIHKSAQSKFDIPNADDKQPDQSKDPESKVYPEASGRQFTGNESCIIVNFEETSECINDGLQQMMEMFVQRNEFQSAILPFQSIRFGSASLNGKPVDSEAQLEKAKSIVKSSAPDIIKIVGDLCDNLTQTAIICSSKQNGMGDTDVLELITECSAAKNTNIMLRIMTLVCEEDVQDIIREQFVCLTGLTFDIVSVVMELIPETMERVNGNENIVKDNNSSVAGNYSCIKDLVEQSMELDEPSINQTQEFPQTKICDLMTKTMDCLSPHISKCGGEKTVAIMRRMMNEITALALGPC